MQIVFSRHGGTVFTGQKETSDIVSIQDGYLGAVTASLQTQGSLLGSSS